MAHRILGIDLGHFSIKLAYLETGFRSLRLLSVHEQKLSLSPSGSLTESLKERQVRTLQSMMEEYRLKPESVATALDSPGMFRLLSLPFADPKKIESVLPFELEGELLTRIEEQSIDFFVVPSQGEQKSPAAGKPHQILAAVAHKEQVDHLLERFGNLNLQLKLIGGAALALGTLCTVPEVIPTARPIALLDLGHRFSHLCVLNHPTIPGFARTLERGGYDLDRFLSQRLQIDLEKAQALKHAAQIINSDEDEDPKAHSAETQQISSLLKEALHPLIRDLRQTLAASMSASGRPLEQLLLFGGGSHLVGLTEYLAGELGLPVSVWHPPQVGWMKSVSHSTPEAMDTLRNCASALGLGLALSRSGSQVNFRKKESSYRNQMQLLRTKIPAFVGSAMAIFLCGAISLAASFYSLNRETKMLEDQMQKQTKALFGQEILNIHDIETRLNKKALGDQIPQLSALDLLESLSAHAPKQVTEAGQTVNADLEVTDLDIKSQQIVVKATVASAQYIDDLEKEWAHLPCIKGITKGKIQPLAEKNRKQFSMELSTCL